MIKKIYILALLFFTSISFASAHVAYVVEDTERKNAMGYDFSFLLAPFQNLQYVLLMIATVVAVGLINLFIHFNPITERITSHARKVLGSYHELIPWIMRLALGITLIGAGTSNMLLSPIITNPEFSFIQILVGFSFLLGFLIAPASILTIALYLVALSTDSYIIGNIDVLALALGILVFHSGRPGIDDILGISLLSRIKIPRKYFTLILRLGIGGAMIFLGLYEKILNPHMSAIVVENFHLTSLVPVSQNLWVLGAGLTEFFIGFFIILGIFTRTVSVVAFAVLSLSFFFFKESVFSHVTLFATFSILVIEGGGYLSVDRYIESGHPLVLHPHEKDGLL